MIRVLIFLLIITGFAALLTMILSLDGGVQARFGGYAIDGTVSGILIALMILMIASAVLTWFISYLMRLPDNLRKRRTETQRRKGMTALTRGLEAVAAGDPEDAQRHAKAAQRQLDEPALTRLLTAQAAQLAGDEATAERSFSAMLEAPETEFLGLRGLYLQALSIGNTKAATLYADRAFKLRPGTKWAFDAAYQLGVDRGSWSDVQNTLKLARKNSLIDTEEAARKEAVILTAKASGAEAAGQSIDALRDVTAALKLAPSFAPAATLAARLEAENGNRGKAARILETAWAGAPHPAIAKSYENLYTEHPTEKRASRLMKLADKAPDRDESRQLRADQYIATEEFAQAKAILEDLLTRKPTARTFASMARAMQGLYGEEQAKPWLAKAAAAPLEPLPGVDGAFHFTTDGWRRLIREFGEFDRLAPPPLEEVSSALSMEEILLLSAPPAEPEPEEVVPQDETEEEPAAANDAAEEEKAEEEDTLEPEVPPQVVITGEADKEETKSAS
jgi:HemY protein